MKKRNINLDKKLNYFKHKIILNKSFIDRKISIIDKYAYIYNLDRRELYGILLLEHVNRGSWITKLIERIALRFFTNYAVKLDLSIGIAQVKISTAKQFYPKCDMKIIGRKLLTDEFNIHICAQIINDYYLLPDKITDCWV